VKQVQSHNEERELKWVTLTRIQRILRTAAIGCYSSAM